MQQFAKLRGEHNISRLVEMAKGVHMSEAQRAEQRNSFVYGNTRIENEKVTRKMVDDISRGAALPER